VLVIVSLVINVSIAIILMLVKFGIKEMKEDISRAEEKGSAALRGVEDVRNDLERTKVNYVERFAEVNNTIWKVKEEIIKHIDRKMDEK